MRKFSLCFLHYYLPYTLTCSVMRISLATPDEKSQESVSSRSRREVPLAIPPLLYPLLGEVPDIWLA